MQMKRLTAWDTVKLAVTAACTTEHKETTRQSNSSVCSCVTCLQQLLPACLTFLRQPSHSVTVGSFKKQE